MPYHSFATKEIMDRLLIGKKLIEIRVRGDPALSPDEVDFVFEDGLTLNIRATHSDSEDSYPADLEISLDEPGSEEGL